MFLPRISQRDCTSAWLTASQAVHGQPKHEAHHIVIDIDDPVTMTPQGKAVVEAVDAYLERHLPSGFLVRTVANTIFPQATYENHGAPDFYDVYIEKVFPRLKRSPQDWGRYFERMIAYPGHNGPINLLADLIAKMKRNVGNEATYRNIYELPIYNPIKDAGGSPRGGQCLSFMSFKLDREHRLLLSAVYRNHYYTEKLLGNLIGLGRLMAFVANEAGVAVGPLSVLSTHAEVDAAGATQAELRALHCSCAEILARPSETQAA
jgi:thymidylate synthase